MSDPESQEQSQQPQDPHDGPSPLEIETEELELPINGSNGHGGSHANGAGSGNGGGSTVPAKRLDRWVEWIREHQVETVVICAVLTVVLTFCSLLFAGISFFGLNGGASGFEKAQAVAQPLTSVPQVKRPGVRTWGALVEMPDDGGRLLVGLRIEDTGTQEVTGLAARAALPAFMGVVLGGCRYGVDQIAVAPCPESVVGEGMQLPDLHPGDWIHIVFKAEVSDQVPGGRLFVKLGVTSDQTRETVARAEVKVPATAAEEAVRKLFRSTEEEVGFWDGKPVLGPRSKRLLITLWPKLTLEHPHAFSDVPGGPSVRLEDLFYDHLFEGRLVESKARVIGRPSDYPGRKGVVKQSVELGEPGERARLLCYTPRQRGSLLGSGDEVELKAVPFAWPPPDGQGDAREMTMAVCPAVRVVGK